MIWACFTPILLVALQKTPSLLGAECQGVGTTPLHANERGQTVRFVAVIEPPVYWGISISYYRHYEKIGSEVRDITAEIPFEIPNSWTWVRLNQIGIYKKGPFGSALTKSIFVKKSNDTIKVYEQKNAIYKDEKLGNYYITKEYFDAHMKGFEVNSGDIIVSCAGTIGETFILPDNIEKGIINQALMRIRLFNSVYKPYFLIYFDYIIKKAAQQSGKGSAIKNIPPFDIFKQMLFPLPPIQEQERIVIKLNMLMDFIEIL